MYTNNKQVGPGQLDQNGGEGEEEGGGEDEGKEAALEKYL